MQCMRMSYKCYTAFTTVISLKMEVIKSNKGGDKLCYDGYMYTKKSKSKNFYRWICVSRTGKSCPGALSTDINVSGILFHWLKFVYVPFSLILKIVHLLTELLN